MELSLALQHDLCPTFDSPRQPIGVRLGLSLDSVTSDIMDVLLETLLVHCRSWRQWRLEQTSRRSLHS